MDSPLPPFPLQINNPGAHKSDSYYFAGNKLIMHNKATYNYM